MLAFVTMSTSFLPNFSKQGMDGEGKLGHDAAKAF